MADLATRMSYEDAKTKSIVRMRMKKDSWMVNGGFSYENVISLVALPKDTFYNERQNCQNCGAPVFTNDPLIIWTSFQLNR